MRWFFRASAFLAAGSTHRPRNGWTYRRPIGGPGPESTSSVGVSGSSFGLAEFCFFFSKEAQQNLAARFVGFDGEEPAIVLHVHLGHGSVHRVVPVSIGP